MAGFAPLFTGQLFFVHLLSTGTCAAKTQRQPSGLAPYARPGAETGHSQLAKGRLKRKRPPTGAASCGYLPPAIWAWYVSTRWWIRNATAAAENVFLGLAIRHIVEKATHLQG
jgi:hypothetical protein